jgi:hypothetical protein
MNSLVLQTSSGESMSHLGPSSIKGFKGLVNFAAGISTGEIKTGMEAAEDFFDHSLD